MAISNHHAAPVNAWVIQIILCWSRASEISLVFLKKGDAWGRIFGYLNWVAKVFSETTDYRVLRATTERFNECIKVLSSFSPHNQLNSITKYLQIIRKSLTSNIGHLIQVMSATFSICILKKWKKRKAMPTLHSTVSLRIDKLDQHSLIYKFIFDADEQLLSTCIDFFLPSLNAISVTLQFLLHRFLLQPEILKKCQDEIDQVVGQGRLPSLNDRIKWVVDIII